MAAAATARAGRRVVITPELPPAALEMLRGHVPALDLVYLGDKQQPSRAEVLAEVSKGAYAICCKLSDCVDKEFLDAAGAW